MNLLKKSYLLSAALVALSVIPSFAADIEQPRTFRPYIGVFGGFDFLPGISATDEFSFFGFGGGPGTLNSKVGDFGGATIGFELGDAWRVEAELSRSYNAVQNFTFNNGNVNTYKDGAVNQTYALANVWYDFHNESAFVPYIGGGIGAGWADGNLDMGNGAFVNATSSTAFAFQVGAGVKFDVSDQFAIDLGYRFKGMTGLNPTVTTNLGGPDHLDQNTIVAHFVQIGATLRF